MIKERDENRPIRIADIAEELGVSTATVSNVIHGKTAKVSEATIAKVQETLEKRGYIPNMAGILLAQNSSKIIGVFVNDHEKYEGHTLEDAFIASSLNHLSDEIERNGFFMMVKKAKTADDVIKFASMWNMDGIVIIGFCHQDYSYLRNHMRIPFVIYDGYCNNPERIANITIDNFDGGRQMGEYFRQKRFGLTLILSDNEIGVDKERIEGFISAYGEDNCRKLILPMQKEKRMQFYDEHMDDFIEADAIFAVSDAYAAEVMRVLLGHGLSVPGDIAVAGFDDNPICEMVSPTLTTVKQDGALRARVAIEKLKELKTTGSSDTLINLPVSLVKRQSC